MKKLLSLVIFLIISLAHFDGVCSKNQSLLNSQGFTVYYYKDASNNASVNDIFNKKFIEAKSDILNFGLDKATYWIKIVLNKEKYPTKLILFIDQPRLTKAQLFIYNSNIIKIPEFNPFPNTQSKFTQGKLYALPANLSKNDIFFFKIFD